MPALEFSRSEVMTHFRSEAQRFLQRINLCLQKSGVTFDFFGGILGHTSTYPNSRRSNYLFQNRRTYFHRNQYPSAVSKTELV